MKTLIMFMVLSEHAPGDPRAPCGRPGARGHHVGDPWFTEYHKGIRALFVKPIDQCFSTPSPRAQTSPRKALHGSGNTRGKQVCCNTLTQY